MKKDILVFHQNMIMGGVEQVTLNLLKNIDKDKFNVKLILVEKRGELLAQVPEDIEVVGLLEQNESQASNKVIKFARYFQEVVAIKKSLKNIIKKDDILLHMNIRNIRLNLTLKDYNNQKIGWIHGNILNNIGTFQEKVNYKLFSQYEKILNVSQQGTKDFVEKFPALKDKCQTLYNSFDIDEMRKKATSKEIPEKNYIVSIGRLSAEKGFDILINAMKLLKDEGFDEKLLIVGDGLERENLSQQIKELELENQVILKGFDANPLPFVNQAKMYVLSSLGEGLPSVLIEALACECPIVSTDCKCGPKEILQNGENGILVEVGDANALKDGIKKMLVDTKLQETFKKKSLARAYDFSNEKVLKQLENIIDSL